MPINKEACFHALMTLGSKITPEEEKYFTDYCNEGVSMAQLVRDEFGQNRGCLPTDGEQFIKEETQQMTMHMGRAYDMESISVPEHIVLEDSVEPDHTYSLYGRSPGPVKWWQEWLEGHHRSLGCMYGLRGQVPPDAYYEQLAQGREEAKRYR